MTDVTTGPHPDQVETVEQLLNHFDQLEGQLSEVREGLMHSHRLSTLGTIAAIIAHEYNNILTPMISYAQLALDKESDHELMKKAVEKSLAGSLRAAHISASLLGFAREADAELVAHLPTVVEDAIGCMAREPQRDNIELTTDLPDVRLAMRPIDLQQVILNLLLNARNVLRSQAGGSLQVNASVEGDLVMIDIIDSGPGIPSEIRDRLFEPFVTQRAAESNTSTVKGTGLGLAICRDLVRNAGGTIGFETEEGVGTTFRLTIPLADELLPG